MANNIMQVFRTSTAGRQPNTTVSTNTQFIFAGQFALNMTDQILYTSDGANLIYVGANVVNQIATNTVYVGLSSQNTIISNGYIQTTNGVYITNSFSGSYTDGLVLDYVQGSPGTIRISGGANDNINFYNNGLGNTLLASLNGNTGSFFLNYTANSSIVLGNSTVNTTINSSSISISNSSSSISINAATSFGGGGSVPPLVIASGVTFTVANNTQVLYGVPIHINAGGQLYTQGTGVLRGVT